ncbi:MAG TPA: SDR family NAD(P)-dependent oxidoreductase, partial [Planctomycetaceae bacterium]|nr:SDR family NAD(P)-dependent oxidoreductase [Planctomycetaceae bacterium]
YALLRGIGTSSDGAGNAVYAPKKEGQIRCLQDAYKTAGVSPDTIELVEAHGTGTKVGDATEVAALNEVYRASGRKGKWCALGSVKSQIGHTKAAAGSAGLLKAVLALQHRVLPPTIKVEQPQDVLDDATSPFYVNTLPRPWMPSENHPRRAAVSAFGFGGSNFHCVLEEAPTAVPEADWDDDVLLLAFSGESLADVKRQLAAWQTPIEANQLRTQAAVTRAAFQPRHEHRLVMVCDREKADIAGMVATTVSLLDKYVDKVTWSTPDGTFYSRGKCDGRLAVLFPGQGSQSVGMLRELACRFPVMQDVLAEANRAYVEAGKSKNPTERLTDFIYPPPAFRKEERETQDSALRATQVAQPALGAVSLGALAVLEQFGVKPEVTAGHSYGELTALCASKRILPAALYRLSMLRGRLMAEAQEIDGGMLAVGASLSQVEETIKDAAIDLVVANRNGPNQVVLSGRLPDIDRAAELFARKNIRGKKLPVAAAFHSPLVATASARFRPELEEVDFATAEVPVFANSSAEEYPEDADAARDLLAGQLAQPVEFVRQIENMYAAGARTFVEVGPGNVLTGLVGSILSGRDHRAVAMDASLGKRGGVWDLAVTVAQVAVAGYPIKLTGWDPTPPKAPVVDPQRLRVPLSGANYVKPRTPKPPRPMMKPAAMTPVAAPVKPAAPVPTPSVPVSRPAAPIVATPAPSVTTTPVVTASMPVSSSALGVLQKMHEETARLHRQFLEGQESALKTLEALARGGSIPAAAVAPTAAVVAAASTPARAVAAPTAVPAPAPLATPVIKAAPAPAPREVALPPTPVAAPSVAASLTPIVMSVVASKTGYPVEMLQPKMSLDHDLGIDSIKRVEILSALQEELPQLPHVTPEQLQTLHRLSDVIALLEASVPQREGEAPAEPRSLPSALPRSGSAGASPSPTNGSLMPIVMSVVAAKTGYPVEMLQPKMSLDHDLGIDSIKRVEILSALQEELPQLPHVTPEQLQTLHRLSDVIALLEASTPVMATATVNTAVTGSGTPTGSLTPIVMSVVAAKTGYPVEMLQPKMSLDHDLGIDSIKRVEILSALQEELPQLPHVTPEQLQTLHRLSDVIALLEASAPSSVTSAPVLPPSGSAGASPSQRSGSLTPIVMSVVASKTGYPVEMLQPKMSLDHDLGIDSIKRVEILSALQEELPHLPHVTPEQLQTLHRLSDVIALLEASAPPSVTSAPILPPSGSAGASPSLQKAVTQIDPTASLIFGEVRALTLPEEPREVLPLPAGGDFWITDDETELSLQLAKLLTAAGFKPRIVRFDEPTAHALTGSLAGLVILSPVNGMSDQRLWHALEWLQKAGALLHQTTRRGQAAVLATVSRLDGACGFGHGLLIDTASGGLAGLSKTVRHEWPEITCKALDLGGEWVVSDAASAVCQELLHRGPVECGLTPGARTTLDVIATPVPQPAATSLQQGDLVLVTGGARGVTAAAAVALAKAVQPRMVLLGRSEPPAVEPDWLRSLTNEIDIKQGLAKHAGVTSPRALQQQCQQVLAQREISRTLQALREAGSEAEYHAVDVRDITAVCRLVEQLQKAHGAVRGIVHGAGVLADQRIEDKTREQFDKVFDTKVVGLRNLLGAIAPESLKVLALFSSFTGRYGRTGQIDYAIANEVLNKLGQQFRRKEPACRVVSFNWGPWDGGMVQGGLKALFAKEGVGLIPLEAGAELFARVVQQPATAAVEVVVLGPGSQPLTASTASASVTTEPPVPTVAAEARVGWERDFSVAKFPVLADHVLGGKAVLPVALVTEVLAHAVMHRHPGLEFLGLDRLKIFKGVRLDRDEVVKLQVLIGRTTRAGGRFLIPAQLVSPRDGQPVIHAVADLWLGNAVPDADTPKLHLTGSACPVETFYPKLFHGPGLRGLERIDVLSKDGISAWSRTAPTPAEWSREPLRSAWLSDPLAVDVALQAMIVWSLSNSQVPCLPCGIGRYRQFRRSFPKAGVQITAKVTHVTDHLIRADIEITDQAEQLIARMEDVENVVDASLLPAFEQRQLS